MSRAKRTRATGLAFSLDGAGAYASPEAGEASVTGFSTGVLMSAMSVLSQETLRPDEDDQQVDGEDHGELPGRIYDEAGDDLDEAHQDTGDERPWNGAEAAHGHHDEGGEAEDDADLRLDVVEVGQQGARDPHAAGADGPCKGEHLVRVDAHQGGSLPVLGGGHHGPSHLGALHQPVDEGEGDDGTQGGHQLGAADEDPAQVDAGVGADDGVLDHPEVGGPEELGGAAQEDGQPEGGEDLGQHGGVEDGLDEPPVDGDPQDGHESDGDGQGHQGVQAEEGPHPEGCIHGQHEELAVGEVDDLHHPKDEGEAHGHQGEDEAGEQPADQGLGYDLKGHVMGAPPRDRMSGEGRGPSWPPPSGSRTQPLNWTGYFSSDHLGRGQTISFEPTLNGQTVEYAPPETCMLIPWANSFCPLASNFTPFQGITICSEVRLVALRAAWIALGSVEPALFMASSRVIMPVKSLAEFSVISWLALALNLSAIALARGFFSAMSGAQEARVMMNSESLPSTLRNSGSTKPAP